MSLMFLYIAKDENGFHFAISDGNKIELSEDGIWLINGAKGIAKDSSFIQFYSRCHHDPGHFIYRI